MRAGTQYLNQKNMLKRNYDNKKRQGADFLSSLSAIVVIYSEKVVESMIIESVSLTAISIISSPQL